MRTNDDLRLGVLGPIEICDVDGRTVDLGTPRQRAIIAALAMADGRPVPTSTLVDWVWGDHAPATAVSTLQRYIASLRAALEPHRAAYAAPTVLVTVGNAYALRIATEHRDDSALSACVTHARERLSVIADPMRPRADGASAADVAAVADELALARRSWRGVPYAELGDHPDAVAERSRLQDLHTAAAELHLVAMLALGRHAHVVGELESMTAAHPLHERWWALLAVALVRNGRQADALEALGRLRSMLADELGVDPSSPLRELHTAILRQDPSLEWTDVPSSPPARLRSDTGGQTAPAVRPVRLPRPRWRLAGRRDELADLVSFLDAVEGGHGGAVLVDGEAGVGKTRLVQEMMGLAADRGVVVALAACSQEGPPPLWPLRAALGSLGSDLGDLGVDDDLLRTRPDGFAVREHVASVLDVASARAPIVLVAEDVHWADPATVAVLDHLVLGRRSERLGLVLTSRSGSSRDDARQRLAVAVARSEGLRIGLGALSRADSAALVEQVAPTSGLDLNRVWERSGGNPFFLTELAAAGGDLSGNLGDVVRWRVSTLPRPASTVLQAASVLDVRFDLDVVSLMVGREEDETRRLLDQAVGAGLVVEDPSGDAAYAFAHGVVREVVYAGLARGARQAWHATVADVLARHGDLHRPERRAALCHHWELAGQSGARQAWRAALVAADHARADGAYAEEAGHLALAVRRQAVDPTATDQERAELMMLRADACRWSGDWPGVSDAVDEAVRVARRLGDDRLAARAAISASEGVIGLVRAFGVVHQPIVDALESLLRRGALADEPALQCRAQLALAMELYYDPHERARVEELVETALAHVARVDDPRLELIACQGAYVALWRLDTVHRRLALAERAVEVARELNDPRGMVVAETLLLMVASELGDVDRVRGRLRRTIRTARDRGLVTPESALRVLSMNWAVLAGDRARVEAERRRLGELVRSARVPHLRAAFGSSLVLAALHFGDEDLLRSSIVGYAPSGETSSAVFGAATLARLGETERASEALDGGRVDLATHTYLAPLVAGLACQLGLVLDRPDLVGPAYDYLAPHAGLMCSAGSAAFLGPVDHLLAMGALALGRPEDAVRHLERAERQAREWDLPGVLVEIEELRTRLAS